MEYAIVDIETTGGHAAGSGITEIAIISHNGQEETGRFHTLVNPLRPIPPYIQSLTGISEDMVSESPAFAEVAAQVYGMLAGRIFVAHNVNFDYSFIKHHLASAGLEYAAPRLCTVRLSRKIRPGLPSYSLGRLCNSLDIPIVDRHRAVGDADATTLLFTKLLRWDQKGHVQAMLKRTSKEQALPPNLPKEAFAKLPSCPGVYYFRDRAGKVVYVGKAQNIRKRVASHFSEHDPNPQRQHFLSDIYDITTETCGTELMALLLEAVEIKRLWPKYNRAMKRHEPRFALYCYPDQNGYLHLAVGKYQKGQKPLHEFSTYAEGVRCLRQLIMDFGLCPALCQLGPRSPSCCQAEGTGEGLSRQAVHGGSGEYNQKVTLAVEHLHSGLPSFMIVDKGRHEGEQSYIAVERGRFYGMGHIGRCHDLRELEDLKDCLTRYPGNHYMIKLILAQAEREPEKVKGLGINDHP